MKEMTVSLIIATLAWLGCAGCLWWVKRTKRKRVIPLAERFAELTQAKKGWNMGKGEPMSNSVKENFHRFLELAHHIPGSARLYLRETGELDLRWKDPAETAYTIRVMADGYRYHHGYTSHTFLPHEVHKLMAVANFHNGR